MNPRPHRLATEKYTSLSSSQVATASGIGHRRLDRWIRWGAITLEHDSDPHGFVARRYTPAEVADLEVLGGLVHRAEAAGVQLQIIALSAMWHALSHGEPWRLVLDIDLIQR